MKKRDYFLIACMIFLCLVLVLFYALKEKEGDTVCIYVNAELYKELPLNKDAVVNLGTNELVIENGYAYMKSANCPDKLCIKQGKISDNSRDIVCLPNQVTIKVTKKSHIDSISG